MLKGNLRGIVYFEMRRPMVCLTERAIETWKTHSTLKGIDITEGQIKLEM
jgi:hypothetical protein